jgi:hypothetical protein
MVARRTLVDTVTSTSHLRRASAAVEEVLEVI